MTGASYNRGQSEQSVGTPREFLDAVERRFRPIQIDLAATRDDRVCERFIGPGSELEYHRDSLAMNWDILSFTVRWLNPPFGNIAPWAAKCAEFRYYPMWTLLLVPYSAGSNWWRDYVRGKAMVFALQPRLKFIGHTQSYPKDLALCAYGYGVAGEDVWRWEVV